MVRESSYIEDSWEQKHELVITSEIIEFNLECSNNGKEKSVWSELVCNKQDAKAMARYSIRSYNISHTDESEFCSM